MTKPSDTLWDYKEHTAAKHQLLVKYLQAWYPIMAAGRNPTLNVIDGFAGPGRYTGGEAGSPVLMIEAFINHNSRAAMDKVEVHFDFIEERKDRADYLRGEVSKIALPSNVHIDGVHHGSFDTVMGEILDALPTSGGLAPTFVFIDPFGYTGHGLRLSSRILQFSKCEVLIYVPLPEIARFISSPAIEPALDNLFGDSSWKAARAAKGKDAERILHGLFLDHVRSAAGYAISFEIDATEGGGWAGYTLYFGTSNPVGLDRMKEAMWNVDPSGGCRFAYSVDPDQLTIFDESPDLRNLEEMLREHFGTKQFTIAHAVLFTILSTPYASRKHLRKRTLAVAESQGRLEARHPSKPRRRRGTFPDGTIMRFVK